MSQSPLEPEIIAPESTEVAPYGLRHEPPAYLPPRQPFRWGCLIGGCLMSMLLVVGVMVALGFGTYYFFAQQVAQYTSTEPRQLPVVEVAPEKMKEIEARVDTFQKDVDQGEALEPLVLTSDELNALIAQQEKLRGHVFVTIEDGLIQADVSFPTDELPGGQGRFFNGSARINASLENGELIVKLDSAELDGQPIPESFMNPLSKQNLAKDINKDPEVAKTLAKFERLEIEGDKLILTPKAITPATAQEEENESTAAEKPPRAIAP
ncbi:MAG: hypothetical protein KDA51_11565 [Planctomycetales bacterium]|nr:hypothetical protein [Planctomycetales bacterium]